MSRLAPVAGQNALPEPGGPGTQVTEPPTALVADAEIVAAPPQFVRTIVFSPAYPGLEGRPPELVERAVTGLKVTLVVPTVIQATGAGAMFGFIYTIDQNNSKQTTGVPAGWGTATIPCWVTKRGGGC